MLGMLVLALADLDVLLRTADVAAAMSSRRCSAPTGPSPPISWRCGPTPARRRRRRNLRRLLAGSAIVASHRTDDPRVQDAYSLRCTPQVHGAARDTVAHARRVADVELRSAIDNPSVLPDGRVESCGHFHGAPIGFACDFLAIAAAEVGSIAERRTDRMLDRSRSHGLPPFLVEDAGVNSGLMIVQYTQAAMVAENRRLAAPASVDSIPTSAMQEDHVSMGWGAARKLRRSVDEPRPHRRRASWSARRGARAARDRSNRRPPPRPRSPRCATPVSRVQDPTGGWHPSSRLAAELVLSGGVVAAVEQVDRRARMTVHRGGNRPWQDPARCGHPAAPS